MKRRTFLLLTAAIVSASLSACGCCLNPDEDVYRSKYVPGEWTHEGDLIGGYSFGNYTTYIFEKDNTGSTSRRWSHADEEITGSLTWEADEVTRVLSVTIDYDNEWDTTTIDFEYYFEECGDLLYLNGIKYERIQGAYR